MIKRTFKPFARPATVERPVRKPCSVQGTDTTNHLNPLANHRSRGRGLSISNHYTFQTIGGSFCTPPRVLAGNPLICQEVK